MFKRIEDVPQDIAEFYTVETRREQVFDETGEPVLHEEMFDYPDNDGNITQRPHMVATFEDNDYVVMLPREQQVSWNKVEEVISKHKGNKDVIVDLFIDLAIKTDSWNYHDEYLTWLNRPTPKRTHDEDGSFIGDDPDTEQNEAYENGFTPAMYDAQLPPTRVVTELNQWKLDNYTILRKAAYGSTFQQLEMQVDGVWEQHILNVKAKYPK